MNTQRQERMSEYSLLDEKISNKISFEGFLYGLDHPEVSWEQISRQCVFRIPRLDKYQHTLMEEKTNKRHFDLENAKYGNNYSGDYNIYSDYAENFQNQQTTSRLESYLANKEYKEYIESHSDSEDSVDNDHQYE